MKKIRKNKKIDELSDFIALFIIKAVIALLIMSLSVFIFSIINLLVKDTNLCVLLSLVTGSFIVGMIWSNPLLN